MKLGFRGPCEFNLIHADDVSVMGIIEIEYLDIKGGGCQLAIAIATRISP